MNIKKKRKKRENRAMYLRRKKNGCKPQTQACTGKQCKQTKIVQRYTHNFKLLKVQSNDRTQMDDELHSSKRKKNKPHKESFLKQQRTQISSSSRWTATSNVRPRTFGQVPRRGRRGRGGRPCCSRESTAGRAGRSSPARCSRGPSCTGKQRWPGEHK